MVLARELTKVHEEFVRGTAAGVSAMMEERGEVRGEVTLVVEGAQVEKKPDALTIDLAKALEMVRESGMGAKRGAALLAELTGLDRKDLYRRLSR